MSQLMQPTWVPKEKSPKLAIRYQSRIVHQIDPIQRELAAPLRALQETTNDIVKYVSLGRMGVTLACINPVLRELLGVGKKGEISNAAREDFEHELNTELDFLKDQVVSIRNAEQPFRLYGKAKNRLGIDLSQSSQLLGERVQVEKYIRSEYPTLSARFEDDLMAWEPHVTIGVLRPEHLLHDELDELQADPSAFIIGRASQKAAADHERFGVTDITDRMVFPDSVVFGGLGVVCNKLSVGGF